jgi:23S rRNA (uracil1939-C5)-methyltransferase
MKNSPKRWPKKPLPKTFIKRTHAPLAPVQITKLNERGYGVGLTEHNREIQVLNALPDELVEVRVFKRKDDILYATAEQILEKSEHRIEAGEEHFLACSPWQIMSLEYQNRIKKDLITDFFKTLADTDLPDFEVQQNWLDNPKNSWNYRNKVEYSFFQQGDALELAFFKREGSYGKYAHSGCDLVNGQINEVAKQVLEVINDLKLSGKQLKSLVLRYSSYENKVIAQLLVRDRNLVLEAGIFEEILGENLKGLRVVTPTREESKKEPREEEPQELEQKDLKTILEIGKMELVEKIQDKLFGCGIENFFQINLPVFELAANDINQEIAKISQELGEKPKVLDLYAGVGVLGLLVAESAESVLGVESVTGSSQKALLNAKNNNITNFDFIEGNAEEMTAKLASTQVLMIDPPRSGLNSKLLLGIAQHTPQYIIYLSCNPKTQAEDFETIKHLYTIEHFGSYDFYPHTPHIETLMVLKKR